jgi:hypothetical protein
MTRQEQIFDIAAQYAINETDGQNGGKAASKRGLLLSAFRDGAHWADSHPQIGIDKRLQDFKKEVEALKNIADAEEYAKQLAHLFLGNGLSLQTILLMAIDFGQQHPNWISVEDELPKEQGKYMFRLSNGDMCYETYYPKLKLLGNVTHWMEIVPPRKEDNK